MKNIPTFIVMLLASLQVCFADNVKKVSVTFDKDDFTLSTNAMGLLEIKSNKQIASYGVDVSEPGLPIISVDVLIPEGNSFSGLTIATSKSLVREDVVMIANPRAQITMIPQKEVVIDIPQYAKKIYPTVLGEYICTTRMDGYTILNFLVSPFEYDAASKKLYLNEKITLTINLKATNERIATYSKNRKDVSDIVKSLVINSEDVDVRDISTQNVTINNSVEKIEYLIVTSNALVPSFQSMARWKKVKGVPSKIISIEEIEAKYDGETTPIKIKNCLYDFYKNKGLKYVLLGGDDTIVPVERCKIETLVCKTDSMPADLFYACFGGSFNWDGNKNGVYGEVDDKIGMIPSIYVTRLPIRTPVDVAAYSSKMLAYEKVPLKGNWGNNILMAGNILWDYLTPTQTDSEGKGDALYDEYIKPYWNGTRKKFYDSYTDFEGGADYELNIANLQKQLSNGYNFFQMITHGYQRAWKLETEKYHEYDAENLQSNGFTIITTTACQTNQFDDPKFEPCLSEAFIRNADNGVVAYLGCSRYGIDLHGDCLGPSMLYEAEFYKNLFSETIENKNFGAIVASAKLALRSRSRHEEEFRWLQLGLNPIGDPEMPIFTTTPQQFSGIIIESENGIIKVNTGVEGCNICVMSVNDNGDSFYKVQKNVREAIFTNINGTASLCITKQNYMPFVKQVKYNVSIQDETITTDKECDADTIKVGSAVTSSKAQGPVIISGGTISLKAPKITIEPKVSVSKNVKLKMSNK